MASSDEKVKVSVLLPRELFDKLEEKAKKSFLGRSSWIIQAITEKITREELEKSKDQPD
jgi:metal-responsive CopG/Arc/MetJ family transcriptional regulator